MPPMTQKVVWSGRRAVLLHVSQSDSYHTQRRGPRAIVSLLDSCGDWGFFSFLSTCLMGVNLNLLRLCIGRLSTGY